MKICQNCFQEFEDEPRQDANPAEVLGDIFIDSMGRESLGAYDARDLCPTCREALGIVNMLGFGL